MHFVSLFRTRPFFSLIAAAVVAVGHGAAPSNAQERVKHLAFIGDLHSTSPVRDTNYRATLIDLVTSDIADHQLKTLDLVTIRTAGNAIRRDHHDRAWNTQVKLTYSGAKAADVPGFISERLVALAEMEVHENSKLIWALEELSDKIDCASENVTVYVISDVVSGGEVKDGKFLYETFRGAPFQGCQELVFAGFGSQFTGPSNVLDAAERRLKSVMLEAGFATVSFL